MSDLRAKLERHGVRTRDSKVGEFAVCCPWCKNKFGQPDHKFHCNVNETKSGYFCYYGWHGGSLKSLVKKLGVRIDIQEPERPTSSISNLRSKLNDTLKGQEKAPRHEQRVDLSMFNPIIGSKSIIAQKAKQYLNGRGFADHMIETYQLMYDDGRIIVPFFEDGVPVYYQARKFMGISKKKVLNPSDSETPEGKSEWLFNIDRAKKYDFVVICEGWASAMTAGYNAVAIQGKVVSDAQLFKLVENWNDFVVLLDSDAKKEAHELSFRLMRAKPKAIVSVYFLEKGDPNDYTHEQVIDFIGFASKCGEGLRTKMRTI